MTPKEKAQEMLFEYDYTTDNYSAMLKDNYVRDLKHESLIDACKEAIKIVKRLNPYEVPFWEQVIVELDKSKNTR